MTSSVRKHYEGPDQARAALEDALGLPPETLRVDRNGHGFILIPTEAVAYVVRMLDWAAEARGDDDDTLSGDED